MLLRFPLRLLLAVPVLLVVQGSTAGGGPPPGPASPLGDPSWALGLRLYRALRSDSTASNTLFSPLLLASSLEALAEGSAGATATQVRDLLKPPAQTAGLQVGEYLSEALKRLTTANGTGFHVHASSALFSKQAPALGSAKERLTKFMLQQRTLGKGGAAEDHKQLQDWAEAGFGRLDGAPVEAEIKAKAGALILANAMRFKGLWEREFGQDGTDRRTFLGKKYTKVVMMHRAGLYRHYEDVNNMVQVLEAPLWGGEASLLLLLPFHVETLGRLEKLLTLELMSGWLEKAAVNSVAISLPTANISSALSLQKQLSALGLTDAWDPKAADFSGLADHGKGKLHLGGVLHRASLELTAEAGKGETELEEEKVEKPKMFYADHPFIILVRDKASGALLLMGCLDHAEGEAVHDEL
ncbi:serine (or cysteine) peptidase inhibitor, clade H, member 2 [Salarias fasciatus]|uniref:Serpin H1-like n=1 Tax=Salarias fasciatus TaxID=181472 RepID=A0A672GVS4_SALFA|nr:serpin H1-like [Salarias fasciatus]XP_029944249.1 serpin H1-like [Salarias fasciatus]